MPTKIEKDLYSGQDTTGHEWDGIKELNTPLPKWWVYVFYATILWSIGYWVLYPAWPTLTGATEGLLGYTNRGALAGDVKAAEAKRQVWNDKIQAASLQDILGDKQLRDYAVAGGRAVFADNCAPCHGSGGTGGKGYPTLADDDWLWGGDIEAIHTTVLHGIRSSDSDTRTSEMPRFGADGILEAAQINAVADYVLSLAGGKGGAAEGQAVFAENCASCHGEAGEGMPDMGAPALNDRIWLYGADKETVVAQITKPRHGVMPAWAGRLDPVQIKQVAVYVHALGGGK